MNHFHLFLTNFSLTELGMVRSTSRTLATSISMTLSLLALKSFSICEISAAVSFSRAISNYLSSFYILMAMLLFILKHWTIVPFAACICWLPAMPNPWLPSACAVYVMDAVPLFLSTADDLVGGLFGLEQLVNVCGLAHIYLIYLFYIQQATSEFKNLL